MVYRYMDDCRLTSPRRNFPGKSASGETMPKGVSAHTDSEASEPQHDLSEVPIRLHALVSLPHVFHREDAVDDGPKVATLQERKDSIAKSRHDLEAILEAAPTQNAADHVNPPAK